MPGEELRRGGVVERGQEMKITVVGFLVVVGALVLLGLIAYQVGADIDKNRRVNSEQPPSLF